MLIYSEGCIIELEKEDVRLNWSPIFQGPIGTVSFQIDADVPDLTHHVYFGETKEELFTKLAEYANFNLKKAKKEMTYFENLREFFHDKVFGKDVPDCGIYKTPNYKKEKQ